jgi:hypothetical protein
LIGTNARTSSHLRLQAHDAQVLAKYHKQALGLCGLRSLYRWYWRALVWSFAFDGPWIAPTRAVCHFEWATAKRMGDPFAVGCARRIGRFLMMMAGAV